MPNNHKLVAHLNSLFAHSTVNGISHAASAPNRFKNMFWLCLVLAGLITFVANVSFVTGRYLRVPVLTSGKEPFTWPDVTFCDNTPVRLESNDTFRAYQAAISQLVNDTFVCNLTSLMETFLQGDRELAERDPDEMLNTLTRDIVLSTLDDATFRANSPSSLLASASYKVQSEHIQTEINVDSDWQFLDFNSTRDLYHSSCVVMRFRSTCYTLRVSQLVQREHYRAVDALQFFIRGNHLAYTRFNSSNNQFGGRVYIHQPGTLPEDGRQIETPPGVSTTVILTQRRQQLLPDKSNCRNRVMAKPVYDHAMVEPKLYNLSYASCHQYLSQSIFYQRCGCYNPHLIVPKLDDAQPVLCFNVTAFDMAGVARNLRCLADTAQLYRNE